MYGCTVQRINGPSLWLSESVLRNVCIQVLLYSEDMEQDAGKEVPVSTDLKMDPTS